MGESFEGERKRDLAKAILWPKKLSRFVRVTLVASLTLDVAGLAFGLFYEGLFYDNLAHFLTTFALIALGVELAQHRGVLPQLVSGRRALVAGAVVGLVGGGVWEMIEVLADFLLPVFIYNPPLDTVMDMAFGTLGGAIGAWRTFAHLGITHPHRLSW
ncbi:MAG TPA: hypothetical protein VFE21_06455 [Rubrobacteraceae bacterium]|nr:hypothetical protein [Rubrobacteraceae bacterium]